MNSVACPCGEIIYERENSKVHLKSKKHIEFVKGLRFTIPTNYKCYCGSNTLWITPSSYKEHLYSYQHLCYLKKHAEKI